MTIGRPLLAAFLLLGVAACAAPRAGTGASPAGAAARPDTITLVTLNIYHDRERWPARLERIVRGLAELDADVIALQEVLQHDSLPNQAETLARRLGYEAYFVSRDPEERSRRYGNAILTRLPVLARDWHALEPLSDFRTAGHVRVETAAGPLDVYVTHLHHEPGPGAELRRQQVATLLEFVTATRGGGPAVLAGDFNATADAPELAALGAAWTDAWAATRRPGLAADTTTLVTAFGHAPRRIDHVFTDRARGPRPLSAAVALDRPTDGLFPSDHVALVTRLVVEPGGR